MLNTEILSVCKCQQTTHRLDPSLAEHDMPCLSKPTDLDLHCLSLNM